MQGSGSSTKLQYYLKATTESTIMFVAMGDTTSECFIRQDINVPLQGLTVIVFTINQPLASPDIFWIYKEYWKHVLTFEKILYSRNFPGICLRM